MQVGRVGKLELTDGGVDVLLDIDNGYDDIPADALAVVGNRSAVGEQYVELQPQTDSAPYLQDGSQIAQDDTRTPIATQKLPSATSPTPSSRSTSRRSARRSASSARPSAGPARTCSGSSTPATPSSGGQRQLRHRRA